METDKLIRISADTLDELAMEFIKAAVATGEFSTFKTESKNPKTWGKLSINAGRTQNPFDPSFKVEYPDVRINGLQPAMVNLTLQVSDLQKPSGHKQVQATKAATIKSEIKAMMDQARRLGVDVSDLAAGENSAGE